MLILNIIILAISLAVVLCLLGFLLVEILEKAGIYGIVLLAILSGLGIYFSSYYLGG
jgi:hypothetical protein